MRIEDKFRKPVDLDEASLALFVNPYYVHGLVEYHRKRVGRYNNSASNTYRFAIQLVQEPTGWLRNQPRLLQCVPQRDVETLVRAFNLEADTSEELWEALCDLCLKHLRIYWKRVKKEIAKQPSPQHERLKPILLLPYPDLVLVELHRLAEQYIASLGEGDLQRHTFTDLVISRLLMDTGLRREHFQVMRYAPDDVTAQLKRDIDNRFQLHIPVGEFKNWNSRAFRFHKEETARTKIHVFDLDDPDLQRDLLVYVDHIRPVLLRGKDHDHVFPVYTTGEVPRDHTVGTRIEEFSARMLKLSSLPPQVKAVKYLSTHSYRHILGTALAKREGLEAAAKFLMDTIEVVIDTYARWVASEPHEDVSKRFRLSRKGLSL